MNIPLLDIVSRLDFLSFAILAILGVFLLYFMLPEKIYGLMFLLALSAAFVGSSISFVADVCTLIRWVIILLLLVVWHFIWKSEVIHWRTLILGLCFAWICFIVEFNLPSLAISKGHVVVDGGFGDPHSLWR